MDINKIIELYDNELHNWDFFSDPQKARLDKNGHIVVCLREYKWYITKEPVTDIETAIKALFEIDWIAQYDSESDLRFIKASRYWNEY